MLGFASFFAGHCSAVSNSSEHHSMPFGVPEYCRGDSIKPDSLFPSHSVDLSVSILVGTGFGYCGALRSISCVVVGTSRENNLEQG